MYKMRLLLRRLIVLLGLTFICTQSVAEDRYTIQAIKMANLNQLPKSWFIDGAPEDEKIDIAVYIWLLRSKERLVLFDAGFHKLEKWQNEFQITDFIQPDKAVELAGVSADQITDVVISHIHWDHMEGAFLFPNAKLHIQRKELEYYAGRGYQQAQAEVEVDEMVQLIRKNAAGKVNLIEGDNVVILPGLRVFTGGKHTYASQYLMIENRENWILTSDNAYLYDNTEQGIPIGFAHDKVSNQAAIQRMVRLTESVSRVLPGHDPAILRRYPSTSRVATITQD